MDGELPENQTQTDVNLTPPPSGPGMDSAAWLREVKAAERETQKWHEQGDKINKRYLDKRENGDESISKYNLFTTNTQILISTLYAKFPKPLVTREYEDPDDAVGRCAAQILERNLTVRVRDSFDTAMKHCIVDRLVPGLGQVWFRYDPTIVQEPAPQPPAPMMGMEPPPMAPPMGEQPPMPVPGQGQLPPAAPGEPGAPPQAQTPPPDPQMLDRLVNEDIATDYVHWKDFIWSPCRVWEECRWVGRKVKMTKADVSKRFGDQIAGQLKFKKGNVGDANNSSSSASDNENQEVMYATVVEIWCKRSRKVYWVSEGVSTCLDVKPDPFSLPHFWPCPKPMFALLSTGSTVPRPDFLMIQDQYEELDMINNRITYLERAVKVVGVYDKTQKEIGRIFTEGIDNQMIAADNFSQFAEKGGFKGMMDFVPINDIVTAIQRLREYRQDLVSQIYELTGISDIMRGATKASETLGAQQLKAQYGSVRLQFLQMEVANFVEEALDIKSRIMIKMFQPQTLIARSNIMMTPDGPQAQQAIELLRSQMMPFRIEVHADSMAVPEFNAERDARMQYLRAVSEFLTAMAPMAQSNPGSVPYLLKMMQWGAAGFRVGRGIEAILDQAIAAATKEIKDKAAAPPPPPPLLEQATAKKDNAQAILNTAKAQQIVQENNFNAANPSNLLQHDPNPPAGDSTTH